MKMIVFASFSKAASIRQNRDEQAEADAQRRAEEHPEQVVAQRRRQQPVGEDGGVVREADEPAARRVEEAEVQGADGRNHEQPAEQQDRRTDVDEGQHSPFPHIRVLLDDPVQREINGINAHRAPHNRKQRVQDGMQRRVAEEQKENSVHADIQRGNQNREQHKPEQPPLLRRHCRCRRRFHSGLPPFTNERRKPRRLCRFRRKTSAAPS